MALIKLCLRSLVVLIFFISSSHYVLARGIDEPIYPIEQQALTMSCWAAVVQQCLRVQGQIEVSQESIIRQVYGELINRPANTYIQVYVMRAFGLNARQVNLADVSIVDVIGDIFSQSLSVSLLHSVDGADYGHFVTVNPLVEQGQRHLILSDPGNGQATSYSLEEFIASPIYQRIIEVTTAGPANPERFQSWVNPQESLYSILHGVRHSPDFVSGIGQYLSSGSGTIPQSVMEEFAGVGLHYMTRGFVEFVSPYATQSGDYLYQNSSPPVQNAIDYLVSVDQIFNFSGELFLPLMVSYLRSRTRTLLPGR